MANGVARSTRAAEFLGLVAFAFSLMLLISIATYHPTDPSVFFKAGASGPTRNFIGPVGAFLAELLIPQLFGVAALLLPIVLGIVGWKLFWCRPLHAPYTKAVGITLMLLALTALLHLTFATVTLEGEPVRAGGAVGEIAGAVLTSSFNRPGAFIVVATTLFVSVLLSTQFSFAAFLAGAWGQVSGRGRAMSAAWNHYLEQRRRERMRREVIRKHAQKEREERAKASGSLAPKVKRVRAVSELEKKLPVEPAPVVGIDEEPEAPDDDEPLANLEISPPHPTPASASTPPSKKKVKQQPLPFMGSPSEAASEANEAEEAPPPKKSRPKRKGLKLRDEGGSATPPTSILDEIPPDVGLDRTKLFERAKALQSKCAEFGVTGTVTEIHPGPVVTTYEFKPDAGVKYSKVVGLSDDLALALEAESIRIDRMTGRSTVAIEIPNHVREMISLRELIESDVFQDAPGRLTLGLGKTVDGDNYVADLAKMPHLLIAGATGTGKSVGLNCMLSSILYKATPEEVRLILIDPKRLELGVYEDIPHLLTPVVTDPKLAANVLRWAVAEMERRIRTLASEGVRNIDQYNNLARAEAERGTREAEGEEPIQPLHYIVIIIDELADLMMVSSRDVEEAITRLAQMARAVGIHLILATQRPSVDVLTGLIKANFPSRISFRVAARVDSRTILDSVGAQHLLGRGDMLFLPPGSARLLRVHGAYVSEKEIARLTSYLRKVGEPAYDDTVGKLEEKASEVAPAPERDALYDEAARFVVESGQASTSMLQRRLRIGFSRAGRLVDMLEQDGIVGPADGSKAREILVAKDYYETVDAWPS